MDFLSMNTLGYPILSILVFLPLAGAVIVPLLPGENGVRVWTLLVTLANAVISLPLFTRFNPTSALYQFAEHHPWIASFNVNYTLGVDGISLLLVIPVYYIIGAIVALTKWMWNKLKSLLIKKEVIA